MSAEATLHDDLAFRRQLLHETKATVRAAQRNDRFPAPPMQRFFDRIGDALADAVVAIEDAVMHRRDEHERPSRAWRTAYGDPVSRLRQT